MEYIVGQRPVSERGLPWEKPDPEWMACGGVQYLSFDAGMMGCFNRWRMYRLDFKDPDDVKFGFVKMFSYVQGTVIDQSDAP